ncbi:MAG: hypothetical protein LAT82_05785 [Nanoarchaeota archaeon]|nr:hypothetical protein [Nanoarchaeota archaeon]
MKSDNTKLSKSTILLLSSVLVVVMSIGFSSILSSFLFSNFSSFSFEQKTIELTSNPLEHNLVNTRTMTIQNQNNEVLEEYDKYNQIPPEDMNVMSRDESSTVMMSTEEFNVNSILEEQRLYVNFLQLEQLVQELNISLSQLFEKRSTNHSFEYNSYENNYYNQTNLQESFFIQLKHSCYDSIFFQLNVCEKITIMSFNQTHYMYEKLVVKNSNSHLDSYTNNNQPLIENEIREGGGEN